MQTQRQYLYGLGLAKAPEGRGRFSAAAHEALTKARAEGMTFSDDTKPEPKPKAVNVKVRGPKPEKVAKPTEKVDPKALRAWAKENGHAVGARGRIHEDIRAAYLAAVPKDEQEISTGVAPGEKDVRPSLTGRYPKGTRFKAEFTYKNKDVTQVVDDRTACYNCGVSLSGHLCDNPKIVTGYGSDPISVSILPPKG